MIILFFNTIKTLIIFLFQSREAENPWFPKMWPFNSRTASSRHDLTPILERAQVKLSLENPPDFYYFIFLFFVKLFTCLNVLTR